MQPTTGYALLDNQNIAYQIIGDAAIDMVNTTGWWSPFDADWGEPNARAFYLQLARFARVIRFDRRGVGASDPVPLDALPSWESLADEIEAVMDAVATERAVILAAGNSGPAGALFAASRPERTSGLILFHTTVRTLEDADYPIGMSAEEHAGFLDFLDKEWGRGGSADVFFPSRVQDEAFKEFFALQQRATTSPTAIRAYLEAESRSDGRALLPAITAPTLVVHRTDSPAIPLAHGRYMADHIPNAKLVEVPGGDVGPYWEHPDIIVAAIEEFVSSIGSAGEPDRQLATVMFTDIVDSTRRAEDLGDRRWNSLLIRHNEIARQTISDHGGRLIKSTGDGVLATFAGPGRALAAASRLRRATSDLGLHLRIGIHTGEIEVRAGDVAGIAVHIAARIMAEAGVGEIVVSRTVKDLVAGSGLAFEDRGTRRLKGVGEDWQLFAVSS